MLIQKYQHLIITIFIFILAILMNLQIPKKNKLMLLLLSLIICIYNPKFLFPLLTSLVVVFLYNKNFKKNKNIESFISSDLELESTFLDINDGNITTILSQDILDTFKKNIADNKFKDRWEAKYLLKTNF